MSTALTTLSNKLATSFGIQAGGDDLMTTLKATAFKGQVSDAQMTALLIVANQYGLNPWTREIYAFPDKNNGIIPVVGVDGWSRIINEHPQFDGIEFEQTDDSCTAIIFRKDRSHPTRVTEYLSECRRPNVGPWQSHPKRMLRHKALIQCARLAFGFVGIFDSDEAESIVERDMGAAVVVSREVPPLPPYPDAQFVANLAQWRALIAGGKKPDQIIAMVSTKFVMSDEQKATLREPIENVVDQQVASSAEEVVE